MAFEKELERELSFAPYIESILANNAGKIHESGIKVFSMQKASSKDDMENGFDFVFTMGNFTVPVRIRKPDCKYRDFTIRSRSKFGLPTEYHKLLNGAGDVYFYGWTIWIDGGEEIAEWWIINLEKFRKSGLLKTQRTEISNGDGTKFIHFKFSELLKHDCIISNSPIRPEQNQEQLNIF